MPRVTALRRARTNAYASLKSVEPIWGWRNPIDQRYTIFEKNFVGGGKSTGLRSLSSDNISQTKRRPLATMKPFSKEEETNPGKSRRVTARTTHKRSNMRMKNGEAMISPLSISGKTLPCIRVPLL